VGAGEGPLTGGGEGGGVGEAAICAAARPLRKLAVRPTATTAASEKRRRFTILLIYDMRFVDSGEGLA